MVDTFILAIQVREAIVLPRMTAVETEKCGWKDGWKEGRMDG